MDATTPLSTLSVERLLHSASDGVFIIDRQRRYMLVNEALERMTGYASSELVGKECVCFEVLDCRDEQGRPLSTVLCPTRSLFDGVRESARQRCQLRRKDGSRLWIETIYTPVGGANGDVEFVFGLVRDITEAKGREDELLAEIASLQEHPVRPGDCDKASAGKTGNQAVPTSAARSGCYTSPGRDARSAGGGFQEQGGGASAPVRARGPSNDSELRLDPLLAQCEREAILRALDATHGQRNKAAQLMGNSRSRLYRRMEALGVDLKAFP